MPDLNPTDILYEDNHLLAVAKPAGLPTMGTPPGRPTLLTMAKEYVKRRYSKPGNVYLGMMSRLDAPVTGVVLLAKTSKAARRLTAQFRTHSVDKVYQAVVEGLIEPESAECEDWVGQDQRHRRMWIVGPTQPAAKHARLVYHRLVTIDGHSLLEVELETGRKHQIRLQLSHRGHPILGDRKYGSTKQWPLGIALHARRLAVKHPTTGEQLQIEAPLPEAWGHFATK